jgi:Serine phosphatase RsbU, regulator of sigma subunit
MAQQHGESGRFHFGPEHDDADSTHFRPLTTREAIDLSGRDESPIDRSFYSTAGSLRMHSQTTNWGLASKITAPVVGALLIFLIIFIYIAHGKVAEFQYNDIKSRAYPMVKTLSKYGRILISCRNQFLREHPEYDTAGSWRVDEHWLVTGGFISDNKWALLVGEEPDAMASVERLRSAEEQAELLNLADWGVDDISDVDRDEMLAAYIIDLSGEPVAASINLHQQNPLATPSAWRIVRGRPTTSETVEDEEEQAHIITDYPADLGHGQVMRVIVPITRNALNPNRIGAAVVLFRIDHLNYERRGFIVLMVIMSALLCIIMAVLAWLSARRVTVPLKRVTMDMYAIAEGDLTRRSSITGNDEIGMLAQAFNSMAERLRVARLNAMEANRLESDLAVAKSIQNSLLPPQTPRIRGLDMYAFYRPAKEIGGDYYDFLPVDSQHMGMVVADASGKSIPAALVMSTTRAILRFVAPGGLSSAETLTRVNAILSVDIPRGMFVTAYYLVYDPIRKLMTCASAGHNPLLIGRADGSVELVNPGGIALGFDQGPIFQRSIKEQTVSLGEGDRVLVYTDGVVECANLENEEYSDKRLQEFLRRHRNLPSKDFVGELLADLDRHRGAASYRDDVTIVTFKVMETTKK